jgi:hypothetical protein
MNSPSTAYTAPPPPYSSYAPAQPASNQPGYISPPESRRSTRDDDKPSPMRASLPSIHEALGAADRSLPFTATSQAGPGGSAPTTAVSAHFPEAPKGPSNPFSAPAPSFRDNPFSSHPASNPPSLPPSDRRTREIAAFQQPPSPRTSGPVNLHPAHLTGANFGSRNDAPPPPASPRPDPTHQSYSFTPVSKAPPPPPATYSSESYQFSAPPPPPPISEHRTSYNRAPDASYDHTIKRHIDVHEAASDLREVGDRIEIQLHRAYVFQIQEHAIRLYDGSQNWSRRYDQGTRSNFFQDSLPTLDEIAEMMRQSHLLMDNLSRVREAVIQQQAALSEHRARFAARPIDDEYAMNAEDYKAGGFASADSKKRRGKAAPPGRCHSCNRAETPEWRRGPDGARTLCNACGLHYAKLTRRMGAGKAAAITGSNLRPKSLDHRP